MNKANAYLANQDINQLILRHSELVKRIAHHLKGRLPASVMVDDLVQAGMIGLLEAIKNFESSNGASFETCAGIRIRGAMLDEIRKGDWTPRSVHRNSRAISQAIDDVEREQGRDALDHEVAQKLNVTLDAYHSMLNDTMTGRIIGIDDLGISEDVIAPQHDDDNPVNQYAEQRFTDALASQIKALPEREALVLSLYYDEELNLKEIGQILSVSESRVSQIHSQALHRLKSRLCDWRTDDE